MSRTSAAVLPRGHYHGWNIVAVTILSQVAANGLTYNTFSLFVRDWSADLHAPISQLQLAVAAMGLVAALASPVIGSLADRYPARRMFAAGLVGIGIFYVAISFATSVWQLIALYGLVVPIALALSTSVTANPLISRWFVRRLGLALGLSAFGIGMAGVLLPPLIAALLPQFGWRVIWRVGGLLVALVVMPLVAIVIRDRPAARDGLYYLTPEGDTALSHGHGGTAKQGAAEPAGQLTWRQVLTRRNFWLLVFIYLPIMVVYGGIGQNLAPYAASHGLSQGNAGQLLSVLSFSHVAATLLLGMLSDRLGNRLPLAGLALTVAAGAALLAFASGFPAIAAGCALAGLGGGVFTLLAAAISAEFGANVMGRAFGMAMFFIPLGALAPFAFARVQEVTGSYVPALLCMIGLVMFSATLSLVFFRERPRGQIA